MEFDPSKAPGLGYTITGVRVIGNKKTKRKRGGQPGHKGRYRELLPENEVDDFVHYYPPQCESCWKPLHKVVDSVLSDKKLWSRVSVGVAVHLK